MSKPLFYSEESRGNARAVVPLLSVLHLASFAAAASPSWLHLLPNRATVVPLGPGNNLLLLSLQTKGNSSFLLSLISESPHHPLFSFSVLPPLVKPIPCIEFLLFETSGVASASV